MQCALFLLGLLDLGVHSQSSLRLYHALSVDSSSSSLSIRKAFKAKTALLSNEAHEQFDELRLAMEILSNEEFRTQYEQQGETFIEHVRPQLNFSEVKQHTEGLFLRDPYVVSLATPEFRYLPQHTGGVWLLNFYNPSRHCVNCYQLADQWREVGALLSPSVNVGAVNCAAEPIACANITHYPTVRAYYANTFSQLDVRSPTAKQITQFLFSTLEQHDLGLLEIISEPQLVTKELPLLVGLCGFSDSECQPFNIMLRKLVLELRGVTRVAGLNCRAYPSLCASLKGESTEPSIDLRFLKEGEAPLPIVLSGGNLSSVLETVQAHLSPVPLARPEASLVVTGLSRLQSLVIAARVHSVGIRVDVEEEAREGGTQHQRIEYHRILPYPVSEIFNGLERSVAEIIYFALSAHQGSLSSVSSERQLRAVASSDAVLFLYQPTRTRSALLRAVLADASGLARSDPALRHRQFYAADCASYWNFCVSYAGRLPWVSIADIEVPFLGLIEAPHSTAVLQVLNFTITTVMKEDTDATSTKSEDTDTISSKLIVLQAASDPMALSQSPPMLVSMVSTSCEGCAAYTNTLARAAEVLNIPIMKLDCDKLPEVCAKNQFVDQPITTLFTASGDAPTRIGVMSLDVLAAWANASLPGRVIDLNSDSMFLMGELSTVTCVWWFDTECGDTTCVQAKTNIQSNCFLNRAMSSQLQKESQDVRIYRFNCAIEPGVCSTLGAKMVPGLQLNRFLNPGWNVTDLEPTANLAISLQQALFSPLVEEEIWPEGVSGESEEVLDLDTPAERGAQEQRLKHRGHTTTRSHVRTELEERVQLQSAATISAAAVSSLSKSALAAEPHVKEIFTNFNLAVSSDTMSLLTSRFLRLIDDPSVINWAPEMAKYVTEDTSAEADPVRSSLLDQLKDLFTSSPFSSSKKVEEVRVASTRAPIITTSGGSASRRSIDFGIRKEPLLIPSSDANDLVPPIEKAPVAATNPLPPRTTRISEPARSQSPKSSQEEIMPQTLSTPQAKHSAEEAELNKKGKLNGKGKSGGRRGKKKEKPQDDISNTGERRQLEIPPPQHYNAPRENFPIRGAPASNYHASDLSSRPDPAQQRTSHYKQDPPRQDPPKRPSSPFDYREDLPSNSHQTQDSSKQSIDSASNSRSHQDPMSVNWEQAPRNSHPAMEAPPHKKSPFALAVDEVAELPHQSVSPNRDSPTNVDVRPAISDNNAKRRKYEEIRKAQQEEQLRYQRPIQRPLQQFDQPPQRQQPPQQPLAQQPQQQHASPPPQQPLQHPYSQQQPPVQQYSQPPPQQYQPQTPQRPYSAPSQQPYSSQEQYQRPQQQYTDQYYQSNQQQPQPQYQQPHQAHAQKQDQYGYYYDEPEDQKIEALKAQLGGEEGVNNIRQRMMDYMTKVGGKIGLDNRVQAIGKEAVQAEIQALMSGGGHALPSGATMSASGPKMDY